jgi:hypothetical protein
MERFVLSCMAAALTVCGLCMVIWPAWVALENRDQDDSRPVTAGEIWTMRLVGASVVAGGGYALYAILTGMPGAEFSGV